MTDETTNPQHAARESFSGKTMTETQFQTAWAISGIINEEIKQSGSFIEALTDYSHAFARPERFDAMRGEKMIRDIYSARFDQSMNQTREGLKVAEDNMPDIAKTRALDCAESIGQLIEKAPTQPFYKAYDRAAVTLAKELNITQLGAKAMMKDAFQQQHGAALYETGKALEEKFHTPVREAEKEARIAERTTSRTQSQQR